MSNSNSEEATTNNSELAANEDNNNEDEENDEADEDYINKNNSSEIEENSSQDETTSVYSSKRRKQTTLSNYTNNSETNLKNTNNTNTSKRSFNVDALLAPDVIITNNTNSNPSPSKKLKASSHFSFFSKLSDEPHQVSLNSSIVLAENMLKPIPIIGSHEHNSLSNGLLKNGFLKNNGGAVNAPKVKGKVTNSTGNQRSSSASTRLGDSSGTGGFIEHNSNSPFSKVESDNQDVEKWKQTFSKIMARSYKNNGGGGSISTNKNK